MLGEKATELTNNMGMLWDTSQPFSCSSVRTDNVLAQQQGD